MNRTTLLIAMVASVALLAGCYSSGVDRNWGRAQRINFTAQTLYPEAPATLDEPTGLDPETGELAMSGHRKRTVQKTEKATPASLINIGTSLGGT